jgi:hypothetical protein
VTTSPLADRSAGPSARRAGLSTRASLSTRRADLSSRSAGFFSPRALALAPVLGILGSALVGAACGSDPDPPAPPPELSLSAQPTESWCCPGEANSTEPGGPVCRVVATRFREDPNAVETVEQHLVSLTASALDTRTGTLVPIVPPGRCVGISGLCGHFVVTVDPDASPAPAEQIFGLERFELALAATQSATVNVRIRLRDDSGQFLLAPSGEPLQADLALDVSFIESVLDEATGVITCPALGQPPQATSTGG